MKRRLAVLATVLVIAAGIVAWLAGSSGQDGGLPGSSPRLDAASTEPTLVERGRYLALAGNCAGCHSARGGAEYAGGRGIETPFGTVYAGNLTPDAETGLGRWNADDFWTALHSGRSRDGRLLYPAFPYPNYTRVTRQDADALFAFLRTVPAVRQPNRPHALRFPYDSQIVLAGWRALFFRPDTFQAAPKRSAEWNRGAYLVQGLGHCDACHAERNPFGATTAGAGLGGGRLPVQGWDAPPLAPHTTVGVAPWSRDDIVSLLATGMAAQGTAMGPMAEVVARSTQHLSSADLRAIATYLESLPGRTDPAMRRAATPPPDAPEPEAGRAAYEDHCADCHGVDGRGAPGVYPALAGNQTLNLPSPDNAIRAVLGGGFPPATHANPQPYGMPPFAPFLTDREIAAVLTYARQAWGNAAGPVGTRAVGARRGEAPR